MEVNNTFEMTLRDIRGGMAGDELSKGLAAVVAAVRATGKAGKLRLELRIKPASRGETVCVMLEDEITMKLPTLEHANTVFFSTEDNRLQRSDPRQSEFKLREVPAIERPVLTDPKLEVAMVAAAAFA